MSRNTTTGVFTRPVNSFSTPVPGTIIDPSDADATFDAWDAALSGTVPNKVNSIVDPTAADDSAAGYLRSSIWVNTAPGVATGRFWINYNNAVGAAVWHGLGTYDTNNNNMFGFGSGASLTSGNNNLMIGSQAGRAITSGASNILLGVAAGVVITTGTQNVCIGTQAGAAITTDQGHVYIGYQAGIVSNQNSLGTGPWNTGIGHLTMNKMTTGGSNVGLGRASMFSETTGARSVGVGHGALLNGAAMLQCVGLGNLAGGGSLTAGVDATVGFNGDTDAIAIGSLAGKVTAVPRTNIIALGAQSRCGAKDNHVVIGQGMTAVMVSGTLVQSGIDRSTEATAAGVTLTAAQIISSYTLRSGAVGAPFNDTTPTAAAILAALTGPGTATVVLENPGFYWRCRNITGQTQTLLAGAGVSVSGTTTTATGTTGIWLVKFSNTNAGAEACAFYHTEV